ncbi:hypothetical protein BH23BAC1_BH23BAC1_44620 [soil metagenome]
MEKNSQKTAEDKEIKVAKLNFRQSILIALISALSGIIVTYLTVNKSDNNKKEVGTFDEGKMSESSKQNLYYFKITKIDIESENLKFVGVRVQGHVSDNPVAYPIKTLWANIGTMYTSSNYPLFLDKKEGSLNFDVIALDDKGKVHNFYSHSNVFERYNVEKLPFNYNMRLCLNNNDDVAFACANLTLEIRKDAF